MYIINSEISLGRLSLKWHFVRFLYFLWKKNLQKITSLHHFISNLSKKKKKDHTDFSKICPITTSCPIMVWFSLPERQSGTITMINAHFDSAIPLTAIYPTAILTQVCKDTLLFKNIYRSTACTGCDITVHQQGLDKLCRFIQWNTVQPPHRMRQFCVLELNDIQDNLRFKKKKQNKKPVCIN